MSRTVRSIALSHLLASGDIVSRALLAIALALAVVTRLGWLRLIEFQNDESWALSVAASIAHGRSFPLVGIGSSLNTANAPFFVYLMALPELVSRDPSWATGLIGLLDTAAILLTYFYTAYLFDRVTAVSAALFFAISPWGIIYSRKVWGQDALPFFVTLGFWALFAALLGGRRRWIAPGIVLLVLATQLHPTAFYLAIPAAILVGGCLVLDAKTAAEGASIAVAPAQFAQIPIPASRPAPIFATESAPTVVGAQSDGRVRTHRALRPRLRWQRWFLPARAIRIIDQRRRRTGRGHLIGDVVLPPRRSKYPARRPWWHLSEAVRSLRARRRSVGPPLLLGGRGARRSTMPLHARAAPGSSPASTTRSGREEAAGQQPSGVTRRHSTGHSIWWLGLGLAGAAIVESPFALWQARNAWPLLDRLRHLTGDPGHIDFSALRWAGSAVAGSGYPALADVSNLWKPAGFVEVALLLGGLTLLASFTLRSGATAPRIAALALLAWIAVPIAGQIRHSVPIYPHYFIVLYPACFMVMGVGVRALWGWGMEDDGWAMWNPRRRIVGTSSIKPANSGIDRESSSSFLVPHASALTRWLAGVAVAIPVVIGTAAFGNYVSALQTAAVRPDFGVPLARQEALLNAADSLAGGGPIYFGTHDSLAPALSYLSNGRWRIFDDRHGLRLPAGDHPSVLVLSNQATPANASATRWLSAEHVSTLTLADWNAIGLYRLAPLAIEADPDYHIMDARFDTGMTLTGFRIVSDRARHQLLLDLHWRFAGAPPTKVPTVFNHLLNPAGDTVAQIDGLAYDSTDWRENELALDEFDMPWPTAPGPYRLQVGLYDYPSMRRFQLTNPAEGAPRDSLDLGPVVLLPDQAVP